MVDPMPDPDDCFGCKALREENARLRQRVEELERERVAPDDLGVMRDASGLSERCHELVRRLLKQSQRAEAAEAKLEKVVEALEQIDRETRSVSDVVALRLGSIARAAIAAAKGE